MSFSSMKHGILSLPGADSFSKSIAEQLLEKDYTDHHCFRDLGAIGLHNHLSHHILAAYDLGASASLIQAIYNDEAQEQVSIDMKNNNGQVPDGIITPGDIKEENWTKWLGDPKAYAAYVSFFSRRIGDLGIARILEDYVFSKTANENGSNMLFRLFSGVLHPFIQVGYGLEFDSMIEVAAGLAQTAIHPAQEFMYIPLDGFDKANTTSFKTSIQGRGRQPQTGASILSLLRWIYDSPELAPVLPYDRDASELQRLRDLVQSDGGSRISALKHIMSQFDTGETAEEFDSRVEELVFASTLLAFATGRENRKPRVDFYLMHLLTSTLFVPSFLKHIQVVGHKKALFRMLLQVWGAIIMFCGRPRINPALLMSYSDHPAPPNSPISNSHPSSIDGSNAESMNPWPAIIADVLHAPDSHTIKSLRTLLYGAINYGTLQKGSVIGAFGADGQETHPGIAEVDGTIFARAAGILMKNQGWVTHGQVAGDWDRSALGWDDAWKNDD